MKTVFSTYIQPCFKSSEMKMDGAALASLCKVGAAIAGALACLGTLERLTAWVFREEKRPTLTQLAASAGAALLCFDLCRTSGNLEQICRSILSVPNSPSGFAQTILNKTFALRQIEPILARILNQPI